MPGSSATGLVRAPLKPEFVEQPSQQGASVYSYYLPGNRMKLGAPVLSVRRRLPLLTMMVQGDGHGLCMYECGKVEMRLVQGGASHGQTDLGSQLSVRELLLNPAGGVEVPGNLVHRQFLLKSDQFVTSRDARAAQRFAAAHHWIPGMGLQAARRVLADLVTLEPGVAADVQDLSRRGRAIPLEAAGEPGSFWSQLSN